MLRFCTGFLGGATATSTVLYFSTVAHIQTRSAQRALVQDQVRALSTLCEADGQSPAPLPAVREGALRPGLTVALQDKWNDRLTNLAAWVVGSGIANRN